MLRWVVHLYTMHGCRGTTVAPIIGVFVLSNNRLLRESIEGMVRKKPDLDLKGAGSIHVNSKNEVIQSGAEVLVVDSLQFVLETDECRETPSNRIDESTLCWSLWTMIRS